VSYVVKVQRHVHPSRPSNVVTRIILPTPLSVAWPEWATHVEIEVVEDGLLVRPLRADGVADRREPVALPWREP